VQGDASFSLGEARRLCGRVRTLALPNRHVYKAVVLCASAIVATLCEARCVVSVVINCSVSCHEHRFVFGFSNCMSHVFILTLREKVLDCPKCHLGELGLLPLLLCCLSSGENRESCFILLRDYVFLNSIKTSSESVP
jgi:hypothetical protein